MNWIPTPMSRINRFRPGCLVLITIADRERAVRVREAPARGRYSVWLEDVGEAIDVPRDMPVRRAVAGETPPAVTLGRVVVSGPIPAAAVIVGAEVLTVIAREWRVVTMGGGYDRKDSRRRVVRGVGAFPGAAKTTIAEGEPCWLVVAPKLKAKPAPPVDVPPPKVGPTRRKVATPKPKAEKKPRPVPAPRKPIGEVKTQPDKTPAKLSEAAQVWWTINVTKSITTMGTFHGKPKEMSVVVQETLAFEDPREAARWQRQRHEEDRRVTRLTTTQPPEVGDDGIRRFPRPRERWINQKANEKRSRDANGE